MMVASGDGVVQGVWPKPSKEMIYLSTNGEVLGQFDEAAVPGLLAAGKITDAAFYWREGMSGWRPISELPGPTSVVATSANKPAAAAPKADTKPIAALASAASGQKQPATAVKIATETTPAAKRSPLAVKPFLPRATPVTAAAKLSKPSPATGDAAPGVVLPKLVPVARAKPVAVQRPAAAPVDAKPGNTASSAEKKSDRVSDVVRKPELSAASAKFPKADEQAKADNVAATGKPTAPAQSSRPPLRPASVVPSDPPNATPVPPAKGSKRFPLVPVLAVGFVMMAAAAGAWWWMNAKPSPIPGSVALAGDEAGPVEIRVFRRDDLTSPWREKLAAADARAAELEKLLGDAKALHREKSILYDEAAGVCAAGEEYNMPDLAELRADRDAKKEAADAAKSEVEKLQSEKDSLLTLDNLLEGMPAPLQTIVADATGKFLLPPPETGEVVLVATAVAGAEESRAKRGWFEVLEATEGGELPAELRFADTNKLSVVEIRNFAGSASP